ncbi:MAG TPA: DUF1292 domain-containing protein [Lachnospiraceae bacterium]|jgi:uncharacterized protein YrzB (UPF0473 family)|nr:DUF1292 domain-containing protein [Lachnospiraceae bacterium]
MEEYRNPQDEAEKEDDDFITLTDDDNTEHRYELLDVIDYSNRKFAVLLPDEEDAEDVIIMEIQDYDSDVNTFLSVDSESTRRAVFELFRTKNSDRFDFE